MRAGQALRDKWAAEARMKDPEFARRYNIHWQHGEYVSRVMQRWTRLRRQAGQAPTVDSNDTIWDAWYLLSEDHADRLRAKCPCGDHSSR